MIILNHIPNEEESIILHKIEELRQRLINAVLDIQSFNDEYVIELSQELDTYILQFQKKNYSLRLKDKRKAGPLCPQFHRNSKLEYGMKEFRGDRGRLHVTRLQR